MLITKLCKQANAYHAHKALLQIAPDAVLVGGAVRDLLLDQDIHDLDYVLPGDALTCACRLGDVLGGAFYPLDGRRGIGRVVWQPSTGQRLVIDVAALQGDSLDADLLARDFTLNAIVLGADGRLYDPLHGMIDIQTGILRTCTPDSLLKDPVRILRAVRFIHKFDLQADTALPELVASATPGLDFTSPERQRDELLRIFALPEPENALNLLNTWHLEERYFPEVTDLRQLQQSPPHSYNPYRHSLVTLRWMARIDQLYRLESTPAVDLESTILLELAPFRSLLQAYLNQLLIPDRPLWLWLRFAALAHDWGKATTRTQDKRGRIRFLGHEAISAELASSWQERYHCASNEIHFVHQVCKGHMRPIALNQGQRMPSRRSLYRFYRDLGHAAPGVILLHIADHLATFGPGIDLSDFRRHLQFVAAMLEPIRTADGEQELLPKPLLNGNDLISLFDLEPGPRLGETLESLREAQAVGEVNNREQAVEWVQDRLS